MSSRKRITGANQVPGEVCAIENGHLERIRLIVNQVNKDMDYFEEIETFLEKAAMTSEGMSAYIADARAKLKAEHERLAAEPHNTSRKLVAAELVAKINKMERTLARL